MDAELRERNLKASGLVMELPAEAQQAARVGGVLEADVGIAAFVKDDTAPMRGVFKQRFKDFLVNEIDTDGEVVRLSDTVLPPEDEAKIQEALAEDAGSSANASSDSVDPNELVLREFAALLGESEAKRLVKWAADITAVHERYDSDTKPSDEEKPQGPRVDSSFTFDNTALDSKEKRTQLHKLVRLHLPTLATSTDNGVTKAVYRSARVHRREERRMNAKWPRNGCDFVRFTMYKCNSDTMNILTALSKMLNIRTKSFGYAGTKDKRGCTTQHVTVYRTLPHIVEDAAKRLRYGDVHVSDFQYVKEGMRLGGLSGNYFTVVLRHVQVDDEAIIERRADSLARHGFINYFGMQRFGTQAIGTHLIGRAMITGNWSLAVSLLLMPRSEHDRDAFRKEYRDNRDEKRALRLVPRGCAAERAALSALVKDQKNYAGAMFAVPRNLRMMYLHAYQSFVWNHMVSERMTKYDKLNPIVGDLIIVDGDDDGEESKHDDDETHVHKTQVRALTRQDIDSGKYTIHDVVLPVPGFNVSMPENELGAAYTAFLAREGITMEHFEKMSKVMQVTLNGDYRHIMRRPRDMKWKVFRYTDYTKPLALTDPERLEGKPEPISEDGAPFLAVRLEFGLPTSTYATMLIREFLKTTTEPHIQRQMDKVSMEAYARMLPAGTLGKRKSTEEQRQDSDSKRARN
eukprot:TRINITY_DN66068_c6_g1_i1.p1 TRINITY_DN66068_c6_g1~~TRINITY_DN66068_c6_g1_i1.p1  ORF type:complete len:687 (+),score=365.49 TRINITY_DN66068_c6_g1_i1:175-2235(+)